MYLNQVTIIGNATRGAFTKEGTTGKKRTTFAVAVNSGQDQVDFFEVVCWDKAWSDEKLKKGSPVLVQGAMRSRKSEEGIVYWSVVANRVLILDGKNSNKKARNEDYEIYQP